MNVRRCLCLQSYRNCRLGKYSLYHNRHRVSQKCLVKWCISLPECGERGCTLRGSEPSNDATLQTMLFSTFTYHLSRWLNTQLKSVIGPFLEEYYVINWLLLLQLEKVEQLPITCSCSVKILEEICCNNKIKGATISLFKEKHYFK